jgi:AraC-like DNA-binding protein
MTEATAERVAVTPAPSLADAVDRCAGFRQSGGSPGIHRVRASAHLKLVVGLDDAFEYAAMAEPSQPPGRFGVFLAGAHTAPAVVSHPGGQSAIEIEIRPMWATALFGLSAADVGARLVEIDDVVGREGDLLADEVRAATTWSERFAIVQRFLCRQRRAAHEPSPQVSWAWNEIRARGGDLTVAELAREVGWGERHLRRRFRAEAGLGPKAATRIARLERAEHLLATTEARPAQVAAACGYADQAHLSRERSVLIGPPNAVGR